MKLLLSTVVSAGGTAGGEGVVGSDGGRLLVPEAGVDWTGVRGPDGRWLLVAVNGSGGETGEYCAALDSVVAGGGPCCAARNSSTIGGKTFPAKLISSSNKPSR